MKRDEIPSIPMDLDPETAKSAVMAVSDDEKKWIAGQLEKQIDRDRHALNRLTEIFGNYDSTRQRVGLLPAKHTCESLGGRWEVVSHAWRRREKL